MTIIAGQFTPQWGHTALAVGFGKLYALRSFPEGSSLCVFDMDVPMDGIMTPEDFVMLGEYHTPGKHSCHITLLDSQAVVCDYTSGTMSLFDLDVEGMPVGSPALIGFEGNGPDPARQASAHIHSSWVTPCGTAIIVADLGSDKIYRFPVKEGRIDTRAQESFGMPDGCGPRHCVFNADGSRLYIATELSDEVLVYSYPKMELMQRCLVNEACPRGGAHIDMSPDGKYLFTSSRLKEDGIAVFRINQDGLLEKHCYTPTGRHPRHFAISNDGNMLLCANRDEDTIEVFAISDGKPVKQEEYRTEKPVFVIIN